MTHPAQPTRCWIRHVRRTVAGETGITIAGVAFIREPIDALGGRQGWIEARVNVALSDIGELTITLPNAPGEDGREHLDRFAYFTRDDYRAGDEWLEVMRESDDAIIVATPYKGRKTLSTVELVCWDVAGQLNRYRGSELDVFDAHAPRDVFEHYTRIPALLVGTDFAGFTVPPWNNWTAPDGNVTVGPHGGPRVTPGAFYRLLSLPAASIPAGAPGDCWTAEWRGRVSDIGSASAQTLLRMAGISIILGHSTAHPQGAGTVAIQNASNGAAFASGPPDTDLQGKRQGYEAGAFSMRLVVRYDRVFALINGELILQWRRTTFTTIESLPIELYAFDCTCDIDSFHLEVLRPFALRGADKGSRRLPGVPPMGGLRARYWSTSPISSSTTTQVLSRTPNLGDDPATDRLEATINQSAVAAPAIPGDYFVRFTGAIYLDLATSDRRVRMNAFGEACRVYIGRTGRLVDHLINRWPSAAASVQTPNLRATLGSEAGWYTIVIDAFKRAAAPLTPALLGFVMEDVGVDAAGTPLGAWAVVPLTRLSPVGSVDEHFSNESHRGVLDTLTQTFGLQWRVEPRTLEDTAGFPGQIPPRVRVGRDTAKTIDDLGGIDLVVDSDASDTVDTLILDAAGIADPNGAGQLAVQVFDFTTASAHLGLHGDYDSVAEMTEAAAVQTRAGSLLALRSSPNEEVGVRPEDGARDLVDTFPLTGQLAKFRWLPGDGVKLDLAKVRVRDRSPRQLTRVEWALGPDAIQPPVVGFRQRPRSPAAVLRQTLRVAYAKSRNYQGTLSLVAGPLGSAIGNNGSPTAVSGSADTFARFPMPASFDALDRVWLMVYVHTNGVGTIEVNGVSTGIPVTGPGLYDITAYVANLAGATAAGFHARIINGTVGNEFQYSILARLRI